MTVTSSSEDSPACGMADHRHQNSDTARSQELHPQSRTDAGDKLSQALVVQTPVVCDSLKPGHLTTCKSLSADAQCKIAWPGVSWWAAPLYVGRQVGRHAGGDRRIGDLHERSVDDTAWFGRSGLPCCFKEFVCLHALC